MKRTGHLIDRICDTDNLYLAYYKAKRRKEGKTAVCKYEACLDANIKELRRMLLTGPLPVGRYSVFKIHDPKERTICSASFHERVIHHAIINVCHEYFERNLICHTYATRIGKGVYGAIDVARSSMRKYSFVVKMDVRKYFDSIDHSILKAKLRHMFKDRRLIEIYDTIIDSYSSSPGKGLPIGNLTSQYFANYYLSAFDHYILEQCNAPAYVRYMDDFLLFARSKQEAVYLEMVSREFLFKDGALLLKPAVIVKTGAGVSFLGYRLFPHKILLGKRAKKRLKTKMDKYAMALDAGIMSECDYYMHITPLLSFAQKAYTKQLRKHIIEEYESRLEHRFEPRPPGRQLEQ